MGFPEEIVWTAVVLLVVIVIAVVGLFALILAFGFSDKSQLSSTIDFVVQTNKPYAIATGLTHYKAGDRNFLEHAIETSYSSLENANSQKLPDSVSDFLDEYDLSFYNVRITRENTVQADISGRLAVPRCGDNLEGFCADPGVLVDYAYGVCGVGRVAVQPGRNGCVRAGSVCCKLDENAFQQQHPGIVVRHCGTPESVCNAKAVQNTERGSFEIEPCGEGLRNNAGDGQCTGINSGTTPICCTYGEAARAERVSEGRLTSASIPLLYKDGFGYAEVTIG
jgi:hypothetical protein